MCIRDRYKKYQDCGDLEETLMAACDFMERAYEQAPVVDVDSIMTVSYTHLVGTLFTNGTTAFAASPQANIAFWNASVKNSGEVRCV